MTPIATGETPRAALRTLPPRAILPGVSPRVHRRRLNVATSHTCTHTTSTARRKSMCVCTQTEGMDGWVRISARTHSRGGGVAGHGTADAWQQSCGQQTSTRHRPGARVAGRTPPTENARGVPPAPSPQHVNSCPRSQSWVDATHWGWYVGQPRRTRPITRTAARDIDPFTVGLRPLGAGLTHEPRRSSEMEFRRRRPSEDPLRQLHEP